MYVAHRLLGDADDLGIYAILFDREEATQLDEFVTRQLGALMS